LFSVADGGRGIEAATAPRPPIFRAAGGVSMFQAWTMPANRHTA